MEAANFALFSVCSLWRYKSSPLLFAFGLLSRMVFVTGRVTATCDLTAMQQCISYNALPNERDAIDTLCQFVCI